MFFLFDIFNLLKTFHQEIRFSVAISPEDQKLKIQQKLNEYIAYFDNKLSQQTEFPYYLKTWIYNEQFGEVPISWEYRKLLKNYYEQSGWRVKIYCNCLGGSPISPYYQPTHRQRHKKHQYLFCLDYEDPGFCDELQFSFPGPLQKFFRQIKQYFLNFFAPKIPALPPKQHPYRD